MVLPVRLTPHYLNVSRFQWMSTPFFRTFLPCLFNNVWTTLTSFGITIQVLPPPSSTIRQNIPWSYSCQKSPKPIWAVRCGSACVQPYSALLARNGPRPVDSMAEPTRSGRGIAIGMKLTPITLIALRIVGWSFWVRMKRGRECSSLSFVVRLHYMYLLVTCTPGTSRSTF